MNSGKFPKHNRGFTLIELLIVVAIIALLAAILFPVFSRARENARRSACASNMKQIGLGLMQYTQDFDEKLPVQSQPDSLGIINYAQYPASGIAHNWIWAVQPYVKSWDVFACPSMPLSTAVYVPNGNSKCSYALNAVVEGRALSIIPNPADIIWQQEQSLTYNLARQLPYRSGTKYSAWFYADASSYSHFAGGNLLFCDGHVKWRKLSGIAAKEFGLAATTLVGVPPAPYTELGTPLF